jgi:hypothetical protein
VFFVEVDEAQVCEYDVIGLFNYFKGLEIKDHFLSRGKVLFHPAW